MTDFVARYVTFDDPIDAYDQVRARLAELFDGALDEPSSGWLRRHVVNLLGEYAAIAEGKPERGPGAVPDDLPHGAGDFALAADQARQAFARPGVLDGVLETQIGPQPGRAVFQHVLNELIAHGWDLAHCLGRTLELPDTIVERSRASWQAFFETFGRPEVNFAAELPAPPDATPIDRLAAYLGRSVG